MTRRRLEHVLRKAQGATRRRLAYWLARAIIRWDIPWPRAWWPQPVGNGVRDCAPWLQASIDEAARGRTAFLPSPPGTRLGDTVSWRLGSEIDWDRERPEQKTAAGNWQTFTTPPIDLDRADEAIRRGGYAYWRFGADDWEYVEPKSPPPPPRAPRPSFLEPDRPR